MMQFPENSLKLFILYMQRTNIFKNNYHTGACGSYRKASRLLLSIRGFAFLRSSPAMCCTLISMTSARRPRCRHQSDGSVCSISVVLKSIIRRCSTFGPKTASKSRSAQCLKSFVPIKRCNNAAELKSNFLFSKELLDRCSSGRLTAQRRRDRSSVHTF